MQFSVSVKDKTKNFQTINSNSFFLSYPLLIYVKLKITLYWSLLITEFLGL